MNPSRVPLGDIADFVNGVAFKPADWEESGRRIIRIQNLTDATKPFNRTNRAVAKKYEVAPGDLLVSWSASLGVFVWEGPDIALVNQHIFRVVPDHGRIDLRYLRHMLSDALIQMERHLHGATMKHVNRGEFLATTIPLPPLTEQMRIAGILDAADALRAKRRRALAQLDALLQSTFLEMFGDPVTNPKGWKMTCVGDVTLMGTGSTPSRNNKSYFGGSIPWVKSTEVNWGTVTATSECLSMDGVKAARLKRYPKGSVVLALYGQGKTRGKCAVLGIDAMINQACCVLVPRDPSSTPFLFQFLKSSYHRLRGESRGGNQQNLNMRIVRNFPVPMPPLDVQQRYAAIAESVEQQRTRQLAHLAELDTLFTSLQSRAFSGDL